MSTTGEPEPELCPKCKKGHLRPVGKASTVGESDSDEPFTPTVHMQDLQCDNDNCDYTHKAASLTK